MPCCCVCVVLLLCVTMQNILEDVRTSSLSLLATNNRDRAGAFPTVL
jgi:hypothetical protein